MLSCRWNYLYFIVHLQSKDMTDCTGPESFVKSNLEKDDLSWFPQGMAKCLARSNESSIEQELVNMKSQLKQLTAQVRIVYIHLLFLSFVTFNHLH